MARERSDNRDPDGVAGDVKRKCDDTGICHDYGVPPYSRAAERMSSRKPALGTRDSRKPSSLHRSFPEA
jgi:hypothetical protein